MTIEKLFVFSEDGGSREDCSIFYSRYLLVRGTEAAIQAAMDKVLGTVRTKNAWDEENWAISTYTDEIEELAGDMERLEELLRAEGVEATALHATCIVQDQY